MTTQRRRKLMNKGRVRAATPAYKVEPEFQRPELFMVHAPDQDAPQRPTKWDKLWAFVSKLFMCRG